MQAKITTISLVASAILLGACASAGNAASEPRDGTAAEAPYPSTYNALPSTVTLIRNATVLTGDGGRIDQGSVLMADGKIVAVGTRLQAPADALVIDAGGKWVTPGIIDNHSHLGVYPSPGVAATSDGNEVTGANTAEVWAEHAVWPQDQGFNTARAGGVTVLQVLPGSANLFGGRGVTLKNVPARTMEGMKFPGAPYSLKMACGENPKRVYGEKGGPYSRMGNVAGYRKAWIKAAAYKQKWDDYNAGKSEEPPERDLQLDTLMGVLNGEILVHNHCYRADEMAVMLDVAREFGYKISAFHHAVEAYKIADLLAESGTCASMWADWWGFKMEALDGIRENIALVDKAGACAIVHSDSEVGIQRLNQEAAKVMGAANRVGMGITPEHAWIWLSLNPAKSMGIDQATGSLVEGKNADLVLWNGNPFSVYTRAEKVYVDGALVYDLNDPAYQAESDFVLGSLDVEGGR
jgi:imidazolonepropionase-like amidohydrolase